MTQLVGIKETRVGALLGQYSRQQLRKERVRKKVEAHIKGWYGEDEGTIMIGRLEKSNLLPETESG